jgi:transposase InsO family protein
MYLLPFLLFGNGPIISIATSLNGSEPDEILTDQGSNFTSQLMMDICHCLSVKKLRTTPYHPMCNGLVERFNGVLKTMLKSNCFWIPCGIINQCQNVPITFLALRQWTNNINCDLFEWFWYYWNRNKWYLTILWSFNWLLTDNATSTILCNIIKNPYLN